MGLLERVGFVPAGEDDNGAVNRRPQPRDMGMPKQSPSLPFECKIVSVRLTRLDWALGHVSRSVGPTGSELADTVPMNGDVLGHVVYDLDQDSVPFSGHQWRPWEPPVYG